MNDLFIQTLCFHINVMHLELVNRMSVGSSLWPQTLCAKFATRSVAQGASVFIYIMPRTEQLSGPYKKTINLSSPENMECSYCNRVLQSAWEEGQSRRRSDGESFDMVLTDLQIVSIARAVFTPYLRNAYFSDEKESHDGRRFTTCFGHWESGCPRMTMWSTAGDSGNSKT